jgi:hypothetical protein
MTQKGFDMRPWALVHTFRLRDPGEAPLGMGRISARDRWRYDQSLSRFKANHGEPPRVRTGEIGSIDGFRFAIDRHETL